MRFRSRPDVGPRVREIAWANGDRYYGKGRCVRVVFRAFVARYLHGRRS